MQEEKEESPGGGKRETQKAKSRVYPEIVIMGDIYIDKPQTHTLPHYLTCYIYLSACTMFYYWQGFLGNRPFVDVIRRCPVEQVEPFEKHRISIKVTGGCKTLITLDTPVFFLYKYGVK